MIKISQIARLIALCVVTSLGTIHTQETVENSQNIEISAQEREFINEIFQTTINFTQQINQIIEQLAILVNKNHIKGLPNKDQIKRIFIEDRQILGSLMQSVGTINDPMMQIQLSMALLNMCDEFIAHLEDGLKSGLKKIKPFDITTFANKPPKFKSLSMDKLPDMLMETQDRINKLKEKASKAGLTWYNLAARSVDKYMVTPWHKWHGTTIVTSVGGAALIGGYALWKFGHETPENSIMKKANQFLISKLGEPGFVTQSGKIELRNTSENHGSCFLPVNKGLKLPGVIDASINSILSNNWPLALIGGTFLWKQYTTTWDQSVKPWLEQRISIFWNKARGGAYLNSETPGLLSIDPKVNFDDMTGLEEVKEEFSTILNYLDNPEQFTRANAKPEMGWILTGPTRTGKSFSFECLCGEIVKMQRAKGQDDFKFLKIGIEEIQKYTIQGLLAFAKDNAPMIIFVDEVDLLGLQRVGDNKLLHDFLTAFQSTKTDDPNKIVIVMAATNCPETLDKALRQYGRFGKEIRFEYPGFKYRKEYLTKELSNMALNTKNFDIDSLVAKTNNKSYEDIQAIIRSAMTRSWALGVPVTQQMLEDSINKEIHKIIMIDRKELPEQEIRILASHFAGEALAMMLLNTNAKLDKVTTKAIMTQLQETTAWYVMHAQNSKEEQKKIVHGGIFTKYLNDTINLKTHEQLINEVKVMLAGFAAEEILLGSCSMQCHAEENARAYDILDQLVFEGTDPNQLSKNIRNQLHEKAYNLRNQYRNEIKQLLEQHHDALVAITKALMKKAILSDKDIQDIINTVENKTTTTITNAVVA